jgi:hypothetical protein
MWWCVIGRSFSPFVRHASSSSHASVIRCHPMARGVHLQTWSSHFDYICVGDPHLVLTFPPRRTGFPRPGHMGFVVEKVALGQVLSEYFSFPSQSFHRLLHTHPHPLSGTGTVSHSGRRIKLIQSLPGKKIRKCYHVNLILAHISGIWVKLDIIFIYKLRDVYEAWFWNIRNALTSQGSNTQ